MSTPTPDSRLKKDWQYMYQGGRFDTATGLYHFGARNYSPSLGVWISQDPLQYVNGANSYQMEVSDPSGLVDPTGLAAGGGVDMGFGALNNVAVRSGYGPVPGGSAPMLAAQPPQLQLGNSLHKIIEKEYESATGQAQWYNRALKTIVPGAEGNLSKLPAGTEALRPDIVNGKDLYLYEIKSAQTGSAAAVAKATVYVSALKKACVRATLGPARGLGTSGETTLGGKEYVWNSPVAGAIIYTLQPTQPAPQPIPLPVRAPVPVSDPALGTGAAVEGEGAATAGEAVGVGEAVGAGEAAGVGFEASDLLYLAVFALL